MAHTTRTVTIAAGTSTWLCPPNVHSIDIVGWGSGGDGGHSANTMGGGGGGGGAYAKRSGQAVTPGTTYSTQVGALLDTKFYKGASTYLLAARGDDGTAGSDPDEPGEAGEPGFDYECIGDTTYSGDYGQAGAAGFGANGGDGANGGGAGGKTAGQNGTAPGGGGAGGGKNGNGGSGASGSLTLTLYYSSRLDSVRYV